MLFGKGWVWRPAEAVPDTFICWAWAIMRSMGPPGTNRVMTNTMTVMPKKVGMISSNRRIK